jgi:hypothetical protein
MTVQVSASGIRNDLFWQTQIFAIFIALLHLK